MQEQPSGPRRPNEYLGSRVRTLALAAGVFLLLPGFQVQAGPEYHDYDALTDALRGVVRSHSNLARMESLGKTLERRDIWMVEVANRQGTPVEERPALLIVANLEGDQVVGSELALRTVAHLLTNYAADSAVKERLDSHVVYVFPRLNPDGAEHMFAATRDGRRTNGRAYDDDNDGRIDEDGPEDLNGDGLITVMRVADLSGAYAVHPDEPRLMKKAEAAKGEVGSYEIYWEGVDNDGDGFINEDGPGGVDLNRNFQHEYPYYEPDAGPHMVSEVESRALMDFVIAHRNIALVLAYGASDNLVNAPASGGALAPPSTLTLLDFAAGSNAEAGEVGIFEVRQLGRFGGFMMFGRPDQQQPAADARGRTPQPPATTINTADLEYVNAVGGKYREVTGINQVATTRSPKGAFFEYAYFQFGVPAFSTPGWGLPDSGRAAGDTATGEAAEAGEVPAPGPRPRALPAGVPRLQGRARSGTSASTGADTDVRILKWMDDNEIDGFVDWQQVQHPELGTVEVGGFDPYAVTNPPAAVLDSLGTAHAEFAVYLASLFSRVRIADVKVTNHGGGVFEIEAEIENAGFLPTATAHGVRSRSVAPTMVQLDVPPDDVLTGDAKTSFFQSLDGSGARQSYSWVIRGQQGARVELRVRSQKGGTDSATITLR